MTSRTTGDLDLSPLVRRLGFGVLLVVSPRAWLAMGGDPTAGPRVSTAPPDVEEIVTELLADLERRRAQGGDPLLACVTLAGNDDDVAGRRLRLRPTHLGHCSVWRIELAEP